MSVVSPPQTGMPSTQGMIFIHSCPRSLMAHVEWALTNILGPGARIEWTAQPVLTGSFRADLGWRGPANSASRIATDLRGFPGLRFEVTAEATDQSEGERYSCTPSLGIFRSAVGAHGDLSINEERIRGALMRAETGKADLANELRTMLGAQWDEELEPFRWAGDGAPVRWLHEVV